MNDIIPISMSSWFELKKKLADEFSQSSFRGHRKFRWEMVSTLQRRHPGLDINKKTTMYFYYFFAMTKLVSCGAIDKQEAETAKMNMAKYYLGVYESEHFEFDNLSQKLQCKYEISKMILKMRHLGIGTHFIDVTSSIYIATYFALFNTISPIGNEVSTKEDWPCIFVFTRKNPEGRKDRLTVPPFIDDKIFRQQGRHIDVRELSQYNIAAYLIDPRWTREIYNDLYQMNINGYTLFNAPELAAIDYYYDVECRDILCMKEVGRNDS